MSADGNSMLMRFDRNEFRDNDTDKYSVWVYAPSDGQLQAYHSEKPNTSEVWFRFYKFSHFDWKLFEGECLDELRGTFFYNYNKMRLFMLRRMLCSTSIKGLRIERDRQGCLTDESFSAVLSIHPRILRVLMDKVDVLPKPMDKGEERELERQCAALFGKGEGVTDPHEYVTMYCNLVAFWDKFGMNYFDILRLPQDVFSALKKVMALDNMNKSARMNESAGNVQHAQRNPRGGHSVRF